MLSNPFNRQQPAIGDEPMSYLDAADPQWSSMWEELASIPINKGDPLCICRGTCWEYMGSTFDHHHFKHQFHPATGKTEYAYIERVPAMVSWAC